MTDNICLKCGFLWDEEDTKVERESDYPEYLCPECGTDCKDIEQLRIMWERSTQQRDRLTTELQASRSEATDLATELSSLQFVADNLAVENRELRERIERAWAVLEYSSCDFRSIIEKASAILQPEPKAEQIKLSKEMKGKIRELLAFIPLAGDMETKPLFNKIHELFPDCWSDKEE